MTTKGPSTQDESFPLEQQTMHEDGDASEPSGLAYEKVPEVHEPLLTEDTQAGGKPVRSKWAQLAPKVLGLVLLLGVVVGVGITRELKPLPLLQLTAGDATSLATPPTAFLAEHCSLSGGMCVGGVRIPGLDHGGVRIIKAGENAQGDPDGKVEVLDCRMITTHMNSRAYMGTSCTPGSYSPTNYAPIDFRGKRIKYTVDLSDAQCGCVAAMYLVNMRWNPNKGECGGDYYCDANDVCGETCDEIDIQEANDVMWKTTPHSKFDPWGQSSALFGQDYGPGSLCINTLLPFVVSAEFPLDTDTINVNLWQAESECIKPVSVYYPGLEAMLPHLTPVFSYWGNPVMNKDMTWFDGDVCSDYDPTSCGPAVSFSDFVMEVM